MAVMIHDVDEAVRRLKGGELVVLPTQTVYGLAADATNRSAIRSVFRLKERPSSRPLPLLIADGVPWDAWADGASDRVRRLAAAFWPGPLTLVLRCSLGVDPLITAGGQTVALRIPAHPLTLEVLRRFGRAVVAPSANRHGRLSPTSAEAVAQVLGAEGYTVLDGGECNVGIESTVVAVEAESVRLLRRGAINVAALEQALGEEGCVELESTTATTRFQLKLPTEVLTPEAFVLRASEWVGTRTLVIAPPSVIRPSDVWKFECLPAEEDAQKHEVYRLLNQAEAQGAERLIVVLSKSSGLGQVLRERFG